MFLFKKIFRPFISFPCAACGNNLPAGELNFCKECRDKLQVPSPPFCPACGSDNDGIFEVCGKCLREEKQNWKRGMTVVHFKGYGRDLIHRFKYQNDTPLARPLGVLAAEKLMSSGIKADFITPIPLHWTGNFLRGYNQSFLFAKFISEYSGIPLKKVLKRPKLTKRQAKLDRIERRKNIKGAFSVCGNGICKNRVILLADDVFTTGATFSAAAAALLDAGAAEVNIIAFARG